MKFTLLEIVQDILNDISGDEVDSINDTSESLQVANIVRSTYWHIVSQMELAETETIFALTETSATTPSLLTIPTNIHTINRVFWDIKHEPGSFTGGTFGGNAFDTTESSNWQELPYADPETFFAWVGSFSWDNSAVLAYTYTSEVDAHEVKYRTDRYPTCYTILDDSDLIIDSFDTAISGSFAQSSLTRCIGHIQPTFTMSDSFTPDLNAAKFNLLMEEAKSACSVKLRQVQDPVADKRARRSWIRSQSHPDTVRENRPDYHNFNNFGRHK